MFHIKEINTYSCSLSFTNVFKQRHLIKLTNQKYICWKLKKIKIKLLNISEQLFWKSLPAGIVSADYIGNLRFCSCFLLSGFCFKNNCDQFVNDIIHNLSSHDNRGRNPVIKFHSHLTCS